MSRWTYRRAIKSVKVWCSDVQIGHSVIGDDGECLQTSKGMYGDNGSLRLSQSLTTYELSKWQLVFEDRK